MHGKIAYYNQDQLCVIDLDTQGFTAYRGIAQPNAPHWSPDGTALAFGQNVVQIMNLFQQQVLLVSDPKLRATYPAWHPTENRIVYGFTDKGQDGLRIYDVNTDTTYTLLLDFNRVLQPDWHPTDNRIVFVGVTDAGKHLYELVFHFTNTGALVREVCPLFTAGRFNYTPRYSPDGNFVVFEHHREVLNTWAIAVIAVTNPDEVILLSTEAANDHFPAWGADGKWVAFERENPQVLGANIFALELETKETTLLTQQGGKEPHWWFPRTIT